MSGSWVATMQASLVATLARPGWWAMALAAFLVRGGLVLVLLPLVALPSTAGITNALGPTVERLILAGPTTGGVIVGTLLIGAVLAGLFALLYAGSWLDVALLGETIADDELDLGWSPADRSATTALAIRLLAHVPTCLALAYASIRIVGAVYVELTAPGSAEVPLAWRVIGHAPAAFLLVGVAWLLGETVGGLAGRRVAAGEPVRGAFGRSIRQVASLRGLATVLVTTAALGGVLVPFSLATGQAWDGVRVALLDHAEPATTLAALGLLVSMWVLGLAVLAAVLAWRATAWTVQIAPRAVRVTQPMLQASEPSR